MSLATECQSQVRPICLEKLHLSRLWPALATSLGWTMKKAIMRAARCSPLNQTGKEHKGVSGGQVEP